MFSSQSSGEIIYSSISRKKFTAMGSPDSDAMEGIFENNFFSGGYFVYTPLAESGSNDCVYLIV